MGDILRFAVNCKVPEMPPLLAEKTPNGLTAKVTTIDAKGTSAAAVVSNALELEDEFRLLYESNRNRGRSDSLGGQGR